MDDIGFFGWVIGIGIILYSVYAMFKDGRENGIGFVIAEVVLVIILAAFGL